MDKELHGAEKEMKERTEAVKRIIDLMNSIAKTPEEIEEARKLSGQLLIDTMEAVKKDIEERKYMDLGEKALKGQCEAVMRKIEKSAKTGKCFVKVETSCFDNQVVEYVFEHSTATRAWLFKDSITFMWCKAVDLCKNIDVNRLDRICLRCWAVEEKK